MQQTRFDEALGLWAVLADIAERNGLTDLQCLAVSNIGNTQLERDLPEARERIKEAIALSRRIGDSYGDAVSTGNLMLSYLFSGNWEELERLGEELTDRQTENLEDVHVRLACLKAWRGEPSDEHVAAIASWREGENIETRYMAIAVDRTVALAEGRYESVLSEGMAVMRAALDGVGTLHESVRFLWPDMLEAAIAAGQLEAAGELVELLGEEPPGRVSPYLRAELHRGRGLLAVASENHDEVESELRTAIEQLTSLAYPYPLARAEIDLAAWLIGEGRHAEAAQLLSDAVVRLTPLRTAPLLARASELLAGLPAAVA